MKFVVYVEPTEDGYCAHSPDVPGVVSAADTLEEALEGYREALTFSLAYVRENGLEMPTPRVYATEIEIDA